MLFRSGMENVAGQMEKLAFTNVNEEVRKARIDDIQDKILPKYHGGPRVHIIVGMKSIRLQPKLIQVLESGLGIFISPFQDQFGSDVCYGGPHESFSHAPHLHHVRAYMSRVIDNDTESIHSHTNQPSLAHTICHVLQTSQSKARIWINKKILWLRTLMKN